MERLITSYIERLNIFKMLIVSTLIDGSNEIKEIPLKAATFLEDINKLVLKFTYE